MTNLVLIVIDLKLKPWETGSERSATTDVWLSLTKCFISVSSREVGGSRLGAPWSTRSLIVNVCILRSLKRSSEVKRLRSHRGIDYWIVCRVRCGIVYILAWCLLFLILWSDDIKLNWDEVLDPFRGWKFCIEHLTRVVGRRHGYSCLERARTSYVCSTTTQVAGTWDVDISNLYHQ